MRIHRFVVALLFLVTPITVSAQGDSPAPSRGQMLYAAAYSNVFHGDGTRPFELACTLSVRNVDPAAPIVIERVDYHGSDGELVRRYLERPQTLGPLATASYVVRERDTVGGPGASFLVVWRSEREVEPPLVETVMIGTAAAQGISFTSRARVLRPRATPTPTPVAPAKAN
jgi:hypothetical protein